MAASRFFTCAYAPTAELSLVNSVHLNPADAQSAYVNIANCVYRAVPHASVERGEIAMNAVQRRMARARAGGPVEVWEFMIPVYRPFTIGAVTIEARFLKTSTTRIRDVAELTAATKAALMGDVLTFGQSIVIKFFDSDILLWIKSDVKGLVDEQTEIEIDWRDDNV